MAITIKISTEKPSSTELTLRRLTARDVFTVLTLLTDSVGTAAEVKKIFTDIGKATTTGIGLNIADENGIAAVGISAVWGLVSGLLHKNQDEFVGWLASLVGLTKDEFDLLPPSAVIDVLTVLKAHEDLADFFERLSGVLSSLPESEESSESPVLSQPTPVISSTPSNTDTDGQIL